MDFQKDTTEFFKSKSFTRIVVGLGVLIAVIVVFEAGVAVGFHKARFSDRFLSSYRQNFDRHPSGRTPFGPGNPGDHGAAGSIIGIALPTMTIADVSGTEKTVSITPETIVRENQTTLSGGDLKTGMHVVIFGEPDQNSIIAAKFIRIVSDESSTTQQGNEQPQ